MECIGCSRNKAAGFLKQYQVEESAYQSAMDRVEAVLDEALKRDASAPVMMADAMAIVKETLQVDDVYKDIKKKYNQVLLEKEPGILENINAREDRFVAALQYAITGNYIDFGAMSDVDDAKLEELLDNWSSVLLSEEEIAYLRRDLETAERLLYITDNAGEVVLDKICIRVLKQLYPQLEVGVLVRGLPTLNDAVREDVESIGMAEFAHILDNGSDVPGTPVERLSGEAKEWIDSADLCIAKGQGNFETLRGCGKNIYYLFLCKCELFVKKFGVARFTPVLNNEQRVIQYDA